MRKLLACLSAFVVAITAAACTAPPKTTSPLSPPAAVKGDGRLAGSWFAPVDEGQGIFYLHIAAEESATRFAVLALGAKGTADETPVIWVRGTAHATVLDGRIYYNLRITDNADEGPGETGPRYIPMQASMGADGTLSLRFMSDRLLGRLMDEGRVRGRRVTGGYSGDKADFIVLDMSPADLAALIREVTPERLFTLGFGPFHRLPDKGPVPEIRDEGK